MSAFQDYHERYRWSRYRAASSKEVHQMPGHLLRSGVRKDHPPLGGIRRPPLIAGDMHFHPRGGHMGRDSVLSDTGGTGDYDFENFRHHTCEAENIVRATLG